MTWNCQFQPKSTLFGANLTSYEWEHAKNYPKKKEKKSQHFIENEECSLDTQILTIFSIFIRKRNAEMFFLTHFSYLWHVFALFLSIKLEFFFVALMIGQTHVSESSKKVLSFEPSLMVCLLGLRRFAFFCACFPSIHGHFFQI